MGCVLLAGAGLSVGTRGGVPSFDTVFAWVGAVAFQPARSVRFRKVEEGLLSRALTSCGDRARRTTVPGFVSE